MNFTNTNYCFKVEPIPHCKEYLNEFQCKSCEDGYYWVTYLICALIPVEENCLQRDINSSEPICSKCKLNYRIKDGKCMPIDLFLSTNCGSDNQDGMLLFTDYICSYCKLGYYPHLY